MDFIIQTKKEKFKILQITDVQIIDSAQCRTFDRLSAAEKEKWLPEKMRENAFDMTDELVRRVQPDLVVATGDLVYGEFDDDGTSFRALVEKFDSYGVPWAVVWGNHDNACKLGVDWQIEQIRASKHGIFKKGSVTGASNYAIGIANAAGEVKRAVYMLDSNGGWDLSEASLAQGCCPSGGLKADQLAWLARTAESAKERWGDVPAFACFHIPTDDLRLYLENKGVRYERGSTLYRCGAQNEFGEIREAGGLIESEHARFKAAGVDGVFYGHHHTNSLSFEKDGVRYTFGLKTGFYDYHAKDMTGGTEIVVDMKDGGFTVRHEYVTMINRT